MPCISRHLNNALIDLHTHTTASDGVLSPDELIHRAHSNGVKTLAITDHDSVSGYVSVKDHLPEDFRLISGVEISTVWQRMGIHVVGLNFDATHSAMTTLLRQQSRVRYNRAEHICEKLTRKNMLIDMAEIIDIAGNNQIGRPHIAQAMVTKGYVKNTNVAFNKYLGTGKLGDVKSGWVDMLDAVDIIRQSGGIAVLAHPDHYKMTRTKLLALLDAFRCAGGHAIEVISGKQHGDITAKYAQIARDKGFYASLGSDFHRPLSYAADVGELPELPSDLPTVWTLF